MLPANDINSGGVDLCHLKISCSYNFRVFGTHCNFFLPIYITVLCFWKLADTPYWCCWYCKNASFWYIYTSATEKLLLEQNNSSNSPTYLKAIFSCLLCNGSFKCDRATTITQFNTVKYIFYNNYITNLNNALRTIVHKVIYHSQILLRSAHW